jgi:hypothetical protein
LVEKNMISFCSYIRNRYGNDFRCLVLSPQQEFAQASAASFDDPCRPGTDVMIF